MTGLNQHQARYVENLGKGACVVQAGAGSGKTHTMKELIIAMIDNGIDPGKILAVTFTTKAAAEMRIRIAKAVWPNISQRELDFFKDPKEFKDNNDSPLDETFDRAWVEADPIRLFLVDWVCTIHAMSFRLLKVLDPKIKTKKQQDEWALSSIVKDGIAELKWTQDPKIVQWYIDYAIQDLVDHTQKHGLGTYFAKLIEARGMGQIPDDINENAPDYLAEIYQRYMRYLRSRKLVNFGLMQADLLKLLRENQPFREMLQNMFEYVIVDEGQDTNAIQTEILWTIAGLFKNISYIGDTRQAIYIWNNAHPELMEFEFDKKWNDAKHFPFPTNYRSTKIIVKISNRLIANNYQGDRVKYLTDAEARDDAPDGVDPEYEEYGDFKLLTRNLVETIMQDGEFGKWFILSRTRAECALIHTEFLKAGLPSINLNGGNIFGAPHIRKVIAYAKLACNYHNARNNPEILKEVANIASNKFIAPMTRRSHKEGCSETRSWIDCGCPVVLREGVDSSPMRYYGEKAIDAAGGQWRNIEQQQYDSKYGHPTMWAKGARDLVEFVYDIESQKHDAAAAVEKIIDESIMPWMMHEEGDDGSDLGENGKMEDFDILLGMLKEGMTLEQFIDDADALLTKGSNMTEDDSVLIMTIHKAKGCERENVVLNMTRMPITAPKRREGQLPTTFPPTMLEERNLAYVGATRAKEKLLIVASMEWNGQATRRSQFVSEFGFVFDEENSNETQ